MQGDLKDVADFQAHTAPCISIAQSAAGGRALLAVGCNDASVSVWDVEAMAVVRSITLPDRPVHDVSWSVDGRYLAFEGTLSGAHAHWSSLDIAVLDADAGVFGPMRFHRCASVHACCAPPRRTCFLRHACLPCALQAVHRTCLHAVLDKQQQRCCAGWGRCRQARGSR